jgi:hypothetical protein
MTIEISKPNIIGYQISGYGIKMYCKITEYGLLNNTQSITANYKCTISFGTGLKKFCLIASYSKQNPYQISIDRIEKNDNCILDRKMGDVTEGTAKLVRLALWTMTKLYPHVTHYTFKDFYQIPCDNNSNSNNTLHLGFDYILKYNETWYQKKFNAELPGFISKSINNTQLTEIKAVSGSIMESVYNSFKILDEKLVPIQLVSDLIPSILDYKVQYDASDTPREFINTLRNILGKKYCGTVGKWLNQYMIYLNIDIEMSKWYILQKNIIRPSNYSVVKLSQENTIYKLNGGNNRGNSCVNSCVNGKRQTRRSSRESVFTMIQNVNLINLDRGVRL